MKIINAKSSIKLTLKFTRLDIIRLAEICSKLDAVLDTATEAYSRGGVNIDHVDIEKAGGGLELLWEILKNAEEIR
jgi:hypothetical protein